MLESKLFTADSLPHSSVSEWWRPPGSVTGSTWNGDIVFHSSMFTFICSKIVYNFFWLKNWPLHCCYQLSRRQCLQLTRWVAWRSHWLLAVLHQQETMTAVGKAIVYIIKWNIRHTTFQWGILKPINLVDSKSSLCDSEVSLDKLVCHCLDKSVNYTTLRCTIISTIQHLSAIPPCQHQYLAYLIHTEKKGWKRWLNITKLLYFLHGLWVGETRER